VFVASLCATTRRATGGVRARPQPDGSGMDPKDLSTPYRMVTCMVAPDQSGAWMALRDALGVLWWTVTFVGEENQVGISRLNARHMNDHECSVMSLSICINGANVLYTFCKLVSMHQLSHCMCLIAQEQSVSSGISLPLTHCC